MDRSEQPYLKNTQCLLYPPLLMLLLIFLTTVIVLPGCNTQSADEDVTLNVAECASTLKERIAFQDTLTAISAEMIATIYQIPAADVVQQQVYVSTGATAEEIAVFEAVDNEAAQKIETAVRERLAAQIISFEDYLPAELPKLEDPFIVVKGKYVILCVSDHNADAKKVLDTFLK
ncbi:MAG: DUF4358 domain-containing protein [Dethiobacteria bacterium]|jgi:sorbitol-specific phosphotransferase system component IIBC